MEKCGSCKFYEPDWKEYSRGECHRNPPRIVEWDECFNQSQMRFRRIMATKFPFTRDDNFCGEYIKRRNKIANEEKILAV